MTNKAEHILTTIILCELFEFKKSRHVNSRRETVACRGTSVGKHGPMVWLLLFLITVQMYLVIPDSTVFQRRSKQYNDTEVRSVEWEKPIAGTESIHIAFIILNILYWGICLFISPSGKARD
jgi:hypothetical protein